MCGLPVVEFTHSLICLAFVLILLFPLFMQHSFRMEDGVGHVYAKGNGMHRIFICDFSKETDCPSVILGYHFHYFLFNFVGS